MLRKLFLVITALSAFVLLPLPCSSCSEATSSDFLTAEKAPSVYITEKGWTEKLSSKDAPISDAPEIAFSPHGGAADLVVHTIQSAKSTVRVAAYSFTSAPIAKALAAAKERGVDVKVVMDKSNATARYTAATFLANQGVPVRVDYRYAIMHDKFVVMDGQTVETGSFNFTAAASNKNAENVLVLHDPAVAQRYGQEWDRLWRESEEMKARY